MNKYTAILKYMPTVRDMADSFNLDPILIAAMIMKESSGIPWAVRYEPGWGYFLPPEETAAIAKTIGSTKQTELVFQATSWGLMQVMGTVAREHGFQGWLTELTDPEIAIYYGAKHLRKQYDHRLVYTDEEALAAYNGGIGAIKKKIDTGYYPEQVQIYVETVMRYHKEIKEL